MEKKIDQHLKRKRDHNLLKSEKKNDQDAKREKDHDRLKSERKKTIKIEKGKKIII